MIKRIILDNIFLPPHKDDCRQNYQDGCDNGSNQACNFRSISYLWFYHWKCVNILPHKEHTHFWPSSSVKGWHIIYCDGTRMGIMTIKYRSLMGNWNTVRRITRFSQISWTIIVAPGDSTCIGNILNLGSVAPHYHRT